jgi:hypothetical protein
MSDSRRVYRAIRQAVKQLYPSEPRGNVARHLNTLAGMVTGIVLGKSCQLPTLAEKAPDDSLTESRSKRFSRWLQNETVTAELYFVPFIQTLLTGLAQARPLVFIMDGSEVGHGCLALVISVVYSHRALPIAWVVVRGSKGHFPADTHVSLLRAVVERMPFATTAQFLGMANLTTWNCSKPWTSANGPLRVSAGRRKTRVCKWLGSGWRWPASMFTGAARRCGEACALPKRAMARCR